jgi:hypothetical protein
MGSAIGGIAGGIAGLASGNGEAGIPQANQSQNIANAQNTYGTATSDAAQTMNTAQSLNANSQNVLSGINASNNNAMNAVSNTANQNLSTYGNTFVPLQAQQAQQAQNFLSNSNQQQLVGSAVAGANQGTQAALSNQRAQLAAEGVDPGSIGGAAMQQQAAIQGGAAAAGAGSNEYLAAQQTGNQMLNAANQLGTQIGAQGTAGENAAASIGGQTVSNTNNTNNSNVNNLTAAGTYLGQATNAGNSATNAAASQFNQQQQGYQDQQQAQASQGSSIGNIIGGVAGAASMFGMEKGGPVPALAAGIPLPFLTQRPPGAFTAAAGPVNAPGEIPHYAEGGPISKKGALPHPIIPGTTDSKLIAATPGEFMLPKDVAEFMGHEKLHNLIDKTREKMAQRQGIPTARPTSAHYAR